MGPSRSVGQTFIIELPQCARADMERFLVREGTAGVEIFR